MAKSKWIYDKNYSSWYYLDKNGEMLTNGWIKHSNGKWYYLLEDGKMAKSKWIYDKNYSSWYYLDKNGEMLTNGWIKHSDN
ncbi:endo-beta-N-acetylglucosaminidase, partial [Streptococcus ruminantium]|nr:endo-beta-N-acetylglucosaminidase [Streptococcus ruminantium]